MAFVETERHGQIFIVRLNRPERMNAMGSDLRQGMAEAFSEFRTNDDLEVAIFTGTGRAFCAGEDMKESLEKGIVGSPAPELEDPFMKGTLEKPVIAAVNGAAFAGGLGLVGAADIVIAVKDVQFSFSEVRIGLIPAIISVVCLPKLGTHHGMKLFLTGERFSGAKAVEYGFAHKAVPEDQLINAVEEEIDMINLGGPNAVRECKKLVRRVSQLERDEAFKETQEWSVRMFQTEEGAEGMSAFREKRRASWTKD